ncbi:uncharacterized protein G2W53_021844 [Senna tora]|uniref:Uncharacterized protein n=1 Tax=Senna tora TaxID=362788 RepID=A0A834WHL5_9FABA|nr:uncharacterized protein G2W53_021844 [Senna tora]
MKSKSFTETLRLRGFMVLWDLTLSSLLGIIAKLADVTV